MQPVPGQLDGEPRDGQADPHLVQPILERAVHPDAQVGGQQQERPAGNAWPVHAMTTGVGKDSTRSASVAPVCSISRAGAAPAAIVRRSKPAEK